MAELTLDAFVSDGPWLRMMKERPRDVVIAQRIEVMQRKFSCAAWLDADMAAWLGMATAHFARVVARLRAACLMEKDGYGLRFTPRMETEEESSPPPPRRQYPSDDPAIRAQRRAGDSTNTPQPLHQHSAIDSATTPQADTGFRNPESGIRPVGNIYISNPDPESGRSGPPLTTVERLVAEDMARSKARDRIKEYGEARWVEALEALFYTRLTGKNPPEEGKGAGWLVDHVRYDRPLPKAMIDDRERRAQGAMNLPNAESSARDVIEGGQACVSSPTGGREVERGGESRSPIETRPDLAPPGKKSDAQVQEVRPAGQGKQPQVPFDSPPPPGWRETIGLNKAKEESDVGPDALASNTG